MVICYFTLTKIEFSSTQMKNRTRYSTLMSPYTRRFSCKGTLKMYSKAWTMKPPSGIPMANFRPIVSLTVQKMIELNIAGTPAAAPRYNSHIEDSACIPSSSEPPMGWAAVHVLVLLFSV